MVREMSGWGNVQSGNCPFGEMSVRGNVRRGSVRRESVSRGIVLGEVPVGELSTFLLIDWCGFGKACWTLAN